MAQGKRKRRRSRRPVDLRGALMTILETDLSKDAILAMDRKERRAAREQAAQLREAPGYRSWGRESTKLWSEWQRSLDPNKGWVAYLESIDRQDLGRDIQAENGFHCGRCHRPCDRPYCIPGEPRWLCLACTQGRGQPGHQTPSHRAGDSRSWGHVAQGSGLPERLGEQNRRKSMY